MEGFFGKPGRTCDWDEKEIRILSGKGSVWCPLGIAHNDRNMQLPADLKARSR